jgi:hypothetical protein
MAATLVGTLGGWELVKWLLNRKSNLRIANANADKEELNNERDEFHFLRERLEYKDQLLDEKEKRFTEQTELVRELNKKLLEMTIDNGKKDAEIAKLLAERSMKLCNIRCCKDREPQSGY